MRLWIKFIILFFLFNLTQAIASEVCTHQDVLDKLVNYKVYHGHIPTNNKHFFEQITKDKMEKFEAPGRPRGHASSKHGLNIRDPKVLNILNNPDRLFTGKNSRANFIDIYFKDGSVVITDAGNKNKVITVFGKLEGDKKIKGKIHHAHSVQTNQWIDPSYTRVVKGREEVVGWDHTIGERYVEIPINRPNERINHPDYPLFEIQN